MGQDITVIQTPAEVNKVYCPKCKKVYTGKNKAYLKLAFINESDFTAHHVLYNDTPFEKDEIKCICPVCKTTAMGIYSEFAAEFVEEIISKKWMVISVLNEVDFNTIGSITKSFHRPLAITVKIPESENCANSINITNSDYSVEWVGDDMYELTVNNHTLSPAIITYDINKKIYVEKRRCWYYSKRIKYTMRIESKGYQCIAYHESISNKDKVYNDDSIFAVIDIKHCDIIDIIKDIDIPYGVEIVLKSVDKISIELKRDFSLNAVDKWFASLADKISKTEEA